MEQQRRSRKKEQTHRSIMHSAKVLFEQHGINNVTIEQIAENADVSRSTFFSHFDSLDSLLTEIAAEMGIKTCTENHGFISQDSDRIERLHAAVAHDNFGLLIDIGNFICADEDSAIAVSRLANNAIHVHAKDFYKRTFLEGPADGYFATRGMNYVKGAVIGDGVIPVKQCISILKNAGYDGYVTIEFEGDCDCLEGIRRGKEYLEKII
jgi:sugar phosphate isomerase/epimerase